MKLNCVKTLFILALLVSLFQEFSAAAISPQAVVNEFYKYHFSHDMGFTREAVKGRQQWLTPQLILACRAYFEIPQDPNEPPYINGDPFTGTQEYPEKFSLGSTVASKTSGRVEIIFQWKDTEPRKGTVVLKMINGKWLIDDVEFQDQESLRQLLSNAPKP